MTSQELGTIRPSSSTSTRETGWMSSEMTLMTLTCLPPIPAPAGEKGKEGGSCRTPSDGNVRGSAVLNRGRGRGMVRREEAADEEKGGGSTQQRAAAGQR